MLSSFFTTRKRWRKLHENVANLLKSNEELRSKVGLLEHCMDAITANPEYIAGQDTGFNGQVIRKAVFEELHAAIGFKTILETGTFMGNTTGYFAETAGVPVYTTEIQRLFLNVARNRLKKLSDIHFHLSDSRTFLRSMIGKQEVESPFFIYLDAHWLSDLPLREEVEIVYQNWPNAVVLVDDFAVPGDPGYGFDDYGPGKVLEIGLIEKEMKQFGIAAFFPAKSAAEETGARRGYVVLASNPDAIAKLENCSLLTKYQG